MAESDRWMMRSASAEHGELDSGLFSVENNNLRSSVVGSVVQPGHIAVKPSLDERLKHALGSQTGGQGQHANCVGEQMPKLPRHGKDKPKSTTGGKATRARDSNWDDEQKSELLMGKLKWHSDRLQQVLGGDQFSAPDHHGKSWSHEVAVQLSKTHQQCQRQWDTLLKSRNAIRDHERKDTSGSGTHVSFWVMTERHKDTVNQARRGAKLELLPKVFPKERYELVEFILEIVEGVKKIPLWKKSFPKSSGIAETSSVPALDSDITESQAVGQISDANICQEATINDNLATAQGNCKGADDQKLKNDHDLVSMLVSKVLKDEVLSHIPELETWRENTEKHQAKVIELEEKKLALEEKKLEQIERLISLRNASSGQVEPSRLKCLADEQHVQAYDQMTPNGTKFPPLQYGADANLQYYNTCADSDGQASGVGTDPNSEIDLLLGDYASEFLDGFLCQQSIAIADAIQSPQILSGTFEAGPSEDNSASFWI